MTTTVKRGAGRPAAAARRNKHAQRTPLKRGATGTTAADAIKAQLKDERAALEESAKSTDLSLRKATAAAKVAEAAGWDVDIKTGAEYAKVTAIRPVEGFEETAQVTFRDGKLDVTDMPRVFITNTETGSTREVLLRNANAFKLQVSGERRQVKREVRRGKRGARAPEPEEARLPFDPETATDDVILEGLRGARIWWRNGTAGGKLESAVVAHKPTDRGKSFKVEAHPRTGAKIVHFIDGDRKGRAVHVAKIMRVER